MKIFVTGAAGFIGGAFSRLALTRGHEVLGMVSASGREPADLADKSGLTWLKGSLADPAWDRVAEFAPDVCVHCAWVTTPGAYLEAPDNQQHLKWGLELARGLKRSGVERFVGVGTCIEYRTGDAPLAEATTPLEPVSLYARCKDQLRATLQAEAVRDGSHFCWGRVFYPYGPGEHPDRLPSTLIRKLRAGQQLELKTPHSVKDYIYIDDLAAAMLLTVETQVTGSINWGTGTGVSVRELADTIAAELGRPELVMNAPELAVDPLAYVVADVERLAGLGWKPACALSDGVQKLLRRLPESARVG